VQQALDQQLLINVTAGNVIRLLPPLILSAEQADTIIEKVSQLIFEHTGNT
jgi:acetylornithine aminotransferase